MAFTDSFPWYGPLKKTNTSLAILGKESIISRSYGLKDSITGTGLLNADYIKAFSTGEIGIGKAYNATMMSTLLTDDKTLRNPSIKSHLDTILKNNISDRNGITAYEKILFQSIFTTLIPFSAITSSFMLSQIYIEDIIARTSPLLAPNKLKAKSRKPVGNAGGGNRPRAIGYKGGEDIRDRIRSVRDTLRGLTGEAEQQSSGNYTTSWEVISIEYSTIEFDPSYNYTYSYIDIPKEENVFDIDEIDDPEIKRPPVIIFGIYDDNGAALNNGDVISVSENKWFNTEKNSWNLMSANSFLWDNEHRDIDRPAEFIREKVIMPFGNDYYKPHEYYKTLTRGHEDYREYYNFQIRYGSEEIADELVEEILDDIDYTDIYTTIKENFLCKLYGGNVPNSIKRCYTPMYIEYNGEKISIDPECEYDLKIIEVIPLDVYDNDLLLTDDLLSDNYGIDDEGRVSLGRVYRKKRTPNDDEKFYIIEGKLISDDDVDDESGVRGGGYYRLPHALGVFRVFGRLLRLLKGKILSKIIKLIAEFKNPNSLISTIVGSKIALNSDVLFSDKYKLGGENLLGGGATVPFSLLGASMDLKMFMGSGIGMVGMDSGGAEQPMMKSLLSFISVPIQVVGEILNWLIDFIKSLKNPKKIVPKIKEFLTFEWIMQFVKPEFILNLFGFKVNPGELLSLDIDLNEYLSFFAINKLPAYDKFQTKGLFNISSLLTIIDLLKRIIKAFVSFIWSLFGIESVKKVPNYDIDMNIRLNVDELNYVDFVIRGDGGSVGGVDDVEETSYVYDVKMPDGRIQTFYNKIDLDNYIANNLEMNFDFKF